MTKLARLLLLFVLFATVTTLAVAQDVPYGPTVVAKKSFVSQLGNISSTVLYTPGADGDYRISLYFTNPTGNAGTDIHVTWVDDAVTEDQIPSGWMTSTYRMSNTMVIHALSGNSITLYTANTTPSGYGAYSLYVVVEKL